MKTIFLNIMVLLFFSFSEPILSQIQQINSDFTQKTSTEKLISKHVNSQTQASIAYGFFYFDNTFISMPIPGGTPFTFISNHTFTGYPSNMCKGGDGKYYFIEYFYVPPIPDPLLYEFRPFNDTLLTIIGTISGLGADDPRGIAFNPEDGTYYITSGDALYSFDLSTRTATLIGNFGLNEGLISDICFNNAGVCFGIKSGDWNSNSYYAYTIDITTAVPTLLGPLGYNAVWPQGLSYDFETNTMYISAIDHQTYHGQLRVMDQMTGSTTIVVDWGENIHVLPFEIDSNPGMLCQIEAPSNPNPANGATDVSITNTTLSWTNGTGSSNVEVWFGEAGSVVKVYDGIEISSWVIDTLSYSTTYNWKIICKNDTCTTAGPYWTFLTESDSTVIFYEPFNNLNCWTPIGPQGFTEWAMHNSNNASGSPPSELEFDGWNLGFGGLSQLLSCPISDDSYHYIVKLKHKIDLYAGGSNNDFVGLAVTYDGGITKQIIWQQVISGNIGPEEIETEFYRSSTPFQLILLFNGASFRLDYWYADDLILIDDCMECFPPAGPSNLTAFAFGNPRRIYLHWTDNDWNEDGFYILRKNGDVNDTTQYQIIGTVQANIRNFTDFNIFIDSTYTYRVFAFNQYGTSDSSNTATITVPPIPVELLSFSAVVDADKVTLNWTTATELNNNIFEIERKTGDQEFYTIGYVQGHGTTTEFHEYSFTDKNIYGGTYFYRLKQIDYSGTYEYSDELEVSVTGILNFDLGQNYPNPFNPVTTIQYEVNSKQFVSLIVYDILGNEIATLIDEEKQPGIYEIEFNTSAIKHLPSSGIYFYQLKAGNYIETKKMIFMK